MRAPGIMLLSLLALVSFDAMADGGRPFRLTLTGAAERPTPGDPDATGTALLRVNPGTGEVCYELTVQNMAAATLAHIHHGGPDVAGPPVVTLEPPTDGSSEGCESVERELALDIIRNPGDYYVNVHNAEYPGGAVRAQLDSR